MDKQSAIMCKSFLTLLRKLEKEVGEEVLYDEDGTRYVEKDFDFSYLDTTWDLAMNRFHTPVGKRVIESLSMGYNPEEKDVEELYDEYHA